MTIAELIRFGQSASWKKYGKMYYPSPPTCDFLAQCNRCNFKGWLYEPSAIVVKNKVWIYYPSARSSILSKYNNPSVSNLLEGH